MSLDELIKTEVATRLKSRIYSAMFLSWPFINYKLLIVIFSEGDYDKKLLYIKNDLYPDPIFDLNFHLYYAPLVAVLVVNCVIPVIEIFFTVLAGVFDNWKEGWILRVARKTPFPLDEQAIFFEKYRKEMAIKDQVNGDLNKINFKLNASSDIIFNHMRDKWRLALCEKFAILCDEVGSQDHIFGEFWHANENMPNFNENVIRRLTEKIKRHKLRGEISAIMESACEKYEQARFSEVSAPLDSFLDARNQHKKEIEDILVAFNIVSLLPDPNAAFQIRVDALTFVRQLWLESPVPSVPQAV